MPTYQTVTAASAASLSATELALYIGPPATPADLAGYCAAARRQERWGDPSSAIELTECRCALAETLLQEVDGARAPLKELLERIIGEPVGTLHAHVKRGVIHGERCPVLRIDLIDSTLATGEPFYVRIGECQLQALCAALGSAFGAEWIEAGNGAAAD